VKNWVLKLLVYGTAVIALVFGYLGARIKSKEVWIKEEIFVNRKIVNGDTLFYLERPRCIGIEREIKRNVVIFKLVHENESRN